MKTTTKTKKPIKKNAKTKSKSKLAIVKLAHPKRTVLRHFRLIELKHTFKLIHHRHTAHLSLVAILIFIGVLLFTNQDMVMAQQILKTGTISIGLIVPGPPPSVGAVILSPIDGDIIKTSTTTVSGSCSPQTLVVVFNNGESAGSTVCSSEDIFSLTIQLQVGDNALQAMNYDGVNQAGPATPTVTVKNELPIEQPAPIEPVVPIIPVIAKPLPPAELENPAIIPALTPTKPLCDKYDGQVNTSIGGPLKVNVVCVVRGLQLGEQSTIGLMVYGGQPPYALSVDLDDDEVQDNVLLSIPEPGYKTVPVTYKEAGQYTVKVKAKDITGTTAITQTIIEVNGIVGLNNFASIDENSGINTSWLQSSVPVYLLILVLTLGFWIGDIFDRHFGITKARNGRLKTT